MPFIKSIIYSFEWELVVSGERLSVGSPGWPEYSNAPMHSLFVFGTIFLKKRHVRIIPNILKPSSSSSKKKKKSRQLVSLPPSSRLLESRTSSSGTAHLLNPFWPSQLIAVTNAGKTHDKQTHIKRNVEGISSSRRKMIPHEIMMDYTHKNKEYWKW